MQHNAAQLTAARIVGDRARPAPVVVRPGLNESLKRGWTDVRGALARWHLAMIFGWQDMAQRYKRSKIGVFWLSINTAVMITAIGLLFSMLLRTPLQQFLPYLTLGIIFYSFISTYINESCQTYMSYQGIILQVPLPLFTHLLRVFYRNMVVLGHNIVIIPLVFLAVGKETSWAVLLALPGFLIVSVNVLWIGVILSVFCTRFRDLTQIVTNAIQVTFYMTPIMWMPSILPPDRVDTVLTPNPFFHLLEIVRAPIMGDVPSATNWMVTIIMAVVGWAAALIVLGRYRHRIPFWL